MNRFMRVLLLCHVKSPVQRNMQAVLRTGPRTGHFAEFASPFAERAIGTDCG